MENKKIVLLLVLSLILTSGTILAKSEKDEEVKAYENYTGKVENLTVNEEGGSFLIKGDDSNFISDKLSVGVDKDVIVFSKKTMKQISFKEIEKGDKLSAIIGYNQPIAESYPPQVHTDILILEDLEDKFVEINYFDEKLVGKGNTIKLNIENSTELVDLKNKKLTTKDDLKNKKLMVFYKESTKSIPAETIPLKVIVLDEKENDETKTKDNPFIIKEGKIKDIDIDKERNSVKILINQEKEDIILVSSLEDLFIIGNESQKIYKLGELEEGMNISISLNKNTPIMPSMPAQINIDNIIIKESDAVISRNLYTKDLLSLDKKQKLNIKKDTKIINKMGEDIVLDSVENQDLLVIYTMSTDSIPEKITPEIIIAMGKEEEKLDPIELDYIILENEKLELDNKIIINEDDEIIIPLREVTEELGYEVIWNHEDFSIELVKDAQWYKLKIGEDKYNFGKKYIELGKKPILIEGKTYVPFTFFTKVLPYGDTVVYPTGEIIIK